MKSTYNLTRTLPSCKVDQTLLKELEQYIKQRVASLVPAPKDKEMSYELSITESTGTEKLNSIDEYERTYFPNDIKRVSIECSKYNFEASNKITVNLSFDLIGMNSDIRVNHTGSSAREAVISLADEIIRRIQPYETNNRYFDRLSVYSLVAFLVVIGPLIITLIPHPEPPYKNLVRVTGIAISGAFLTWIILSFLKPYSTFKTRLNEKREKLISWVVLGFLGFLLFTVLGVYLRQKVLGF